MRRVRKFLMILVAASASATACSGANQSGPSASGSGGATINGALVSESGSATKHAGSGTGSSTVPGLVVSVAGTAISSPVNSADQFTLRDVPSGSVQLVFTAPTLSGSVSLADVQAGDTVDIGVMISGSLVALDSTCRRRGGDTELEGRVEALPPTTAAGTFIAAGRPVTTNGDTRFVGPGNQPATFADLAIGIRVHVKGTRTGDTLMAQVVQIQNTRADLPLPLHGIVQNLSGTASAFQFNLGDRLVKGDSDTEFYGNSRFADLANGKRVEVKGELRDGFVYARRIHVNDEDDDDEVEVEGVLTSRTGTAPNLTLVVDGRTVRTDASTIVRRGSTVLNLAALVIGQTLEVEGREQTDGSILARKIQIEGDADTSVRGTLTSRTGTAPTLTLVVNGTTVRTNAQTEIRRNGDVLDFAALTVGQTLQVDGWLQPDSSVVARRIRIE